MSKEVLQVKRSGLAVVQQQLTSKQQLLEAA